MQRNDSVYLGHMLDTARKAVEKARRHTWAQFDKDEDLRIILAHRVQMIEEAAARSRKQFATAFPRYRGSGLWACATVSCTTK